MGTQQGPALVAPEELQPPQSSSLAGAQNWPLRFNRHTPSVQLASTRPTAQALLPHCALRSSPLLVVPQRDHPARPPFPRAQRHLFSSGPERQCCNPMAIRSRGKAGFHPRPMATTPCRARFHPGHLPQRRQAAAVHALPRLRLAPPHARNVWITLACWRCRRATPCSETYRPGPIFHARSRPDPIGCSADHIYPQRAGSHPGPGVGVNPHRRPRPGNSQASPAELLAPSAAADVAGGRLRTETRPRVGRFPSKGCNSVFEPPFPFPRFVPVTAAEMLRESGFCGASSLGRSKSEMPRQSITALRWRLWATQGRTEGGIVWGGHELSNKGDHAAERAKGVGRDRAAPWRGLPKSRQSFVAP